MLPYMKTEGIISVLKSFKGFSTAGEQHGFRTASSAERSAFRYQSLNIPDGQEPDICYTAVWDLFEYKRR